MIDVGVLALNTLGTTVDTSYTTVSTRGVPPVSTRGDPSYMLLMMDDVIILYL